MKDLPGTGIQKKEKISRKTKPVLGISFLFSSRHLFSMQKKCLKISIFRQSNSTPNKKLESGLVSQERNIFVKSCCQSKIHESVIQYRFFEDKYFKIAT